MSVYTRALRPALFALDAERAHDATMAALRQPLIVTALRSCFPHHRGERLRQTVFGVDFANPVGLAAGLDKQGMAAAAWAALGFGFAEIGTVTPRPQPGNPRPRLFRLPDDRAIINRFGFNSAGAEGVAANLDGSVPDGLRIGINIGKNKDTPNEHAVEDYVRTIDALHRLADYIVINVSSPNTQGLRDLQAGRTLRALVEQVVARVKEMSGTRHVPVLVKVSPDTSPDDLLASADAALAGGAEGIVATNTTVSRDGLRSQSIANEAGGLSGAPLRGAANAACRQLFAHVGRRVPIIGVGGIFSADDAYERIRSGATLIQLYTSLIYEGPRIAQRILRGLDERLVRDGFANVHDAIGIDVR